MGPPQCEQNAMPSISTYLSNVPGMMLEAKEKKGTP
jgi:hypothetical protein